MDNKSVSYIFVAIAALSFVLAIGLWIYQIFIFLRTGAMPDFSVISTLTFLGNSWALFPDSWFGLWTILGYIPTSIVLILICIILCLWAERLSPDITI